MWFVRTVNQGNQVRGGRNAVSESDVMAAAWKSRGNVVSLFATPGVPSPHDVAASQAAASGRENRAYGYIVIAEGDLRQLVSDYSPYVSLQATPSPLEIPGAVHYDLDMSRLDDTSRRDMRTGLRAVSQYYRL